MVVKSTGLLLLGVLLFLMTGVLCENVVSGVNSTAETPDRQWVVIWFSNPDNSGAAKPSNPKRSRVKRGNDSENGVPSPNAPPAIPMTNVAMVTEFNVNAHEVHCSQHDKIFFTGATWWCTGTITPDYYSALLVRAQGSRAVLASVSWVADMDSDSFADSPTQRRRVRRDNDTIEVDDNVDGADYGAQRFLKSLSTSPDAWQVADQKRHNSPNPGYDVYMNLAYKFQDQPGKTSRVYVVDTGINSAAYAFAGRKIEYILANPFPQMQEKMSREA